MIFFGKFGESRDLGAPTFDQDHGIGHCEEIGFTVKPIEMVFTPLEIGRVDLACFGQTEYSRGDRQKALAVGDDKFDALAGQPLIFRVGSDLRNILGSELHGLELDAFDGKGVQSTSVLFSINIGCSELDERAVGAAPFGEIGALHKAETRIDRRRKESRHVWGRWKPGQAGLIEPHCPSPILHLDDGQFCSESVT